MSSEYPFVSICTPTYNRRPFFPTMFEIFKNQDYPKDKLEWIIVDDGTDPIKDLIDNSNINEIKYIYVENKMTLAKKRNYMHTFCKGDIFVYMDDDDYYPPNRVSHAVKKLLEQPDKLIAGASEVYAYFKKLDKVIQFGPYFDNHATAATFAFKKELLNNCSYSEEQEICEEQLFLKNFTIPLIQLDPIKTILVFPHIHNTVDKYDVYKDGGSHVKDSDKSIETFIFRDYEYDIKEFFKNKMHDILEKYEFGLLKYKPNAIKQLSENKEKSKQIILNKSQLENVLESIKVSQLKINELNEIITKQTNYIKLLEDEIGSEKLADISNNILFIQQKHLLKYYVKLLKLNNLDNINIYVSPTIKMYNTKFVDIILEHYKNNTTTISYIYDNTIHIALYTILDQIELSTCVINICVSGQFNNPNDKTDIAILSNKLKNNYINSIYFPRVYTSLWERHTLFSSNVKKELFCAYMYWNSIPYRVNIFNKISAYKPVDAIGKCCNSNPNADIDRKLYNENKTYNDSAVEKYSKYKFVLALESNIVDGYITEKLINPILARSIPIYAGSSDIFNYFNKNRIIYIFDFTNYDDLIEHIKKIDNDAELYNSIIDQPIFTKNSPITIYNYLDYITKNLSDNLNDKHILNNIKLTFDINTKINYIDHIVWINLKKSEDRKEYMLKLLDKINIPKTCIEAFDGTAITNTLHPTLSNAEIGCLVSHLKAINFLNTVNGKYFLVVEDDVSFDYAYLFPYDLKHIIQNSPEFDILILKKTTECNINNLELYTDVNKWNINNPRIYSTVAYVITKSGIEKILSIKLSETNITVADIYIYKYCNTFTYKYNFIDTINVNSTIHESHLASHIELSKKELNLIISTYY